MPKLTVSEQRAIIAQRLSDTLNSTDSELRNDREQALNFYYGRPLGNELDGRSQVVSKVLMDVIEWTMPSFMRIFCTQQAVQFDPVGPEDELQAKQETGYVTHVLWKKNDGFMIIYEWAKDGLMQKNGYVKYWWQEEEKLCFEEYSGLTDDQLAAVLQTKQQEGDVEVVGQEQAGDGTWSIKLRIKKTYGCPKVECCDPAEVIVSRNCRGQIKKARFVAHLRKNVTRSELIEEGYDRELVKNLTSYNWNEDMAEALARDSVNESSTAESSDSDAASDELQILDCWTYLDEDDDGIAELRHYVLAGNEDLENEEAPEIPFESWTPIPIPHRHTGLGMHDLVEDRQRIHTALERGLLDNVYFGNNRRLAYSRDVDVSTLQINRPGGHVRVDVNGPVLGHVYPIEYQSFAGQLLPIIEYDETVIEKRTGVSRMTQGVDADVLAQSTKGAYLDARGASDARIEAFARIFAQVGLGSLYQSLHKLLTRHQDWPTKFKLRNDWVETNPADWQERTDLTVSVGLGNASKEEIRANLGLMAAAQEKSAAAGIIKAHNVYALFRRMQTELGFENEDFATDPSTEPPPKPQEDPFIVGEKIKAQASLQKQQLIEEGDDKDRDAKIAIEAAKLHVQQHSAESKRDTDLVKTGVGAHVSLARGANQARPNGTGTAGK